MRKVAAIVLCAALTLSAVPAGAAPIGHLMTGEWLQWLPDSIVKVLFAQTGMEIDPNGAPQNETDYSPDLDPNGAPSVDGDYGPALDPNGQPTS